MTEATTTAHEALDQLTWVAERELYPAVEQRSAELLALLPQAVDADRGEVAAARAVPDSFFQVAAIFTQIEMQGNELVVEVLRLSEVVRGRLAALAGTAEVPRRMVCMGNTWRQQVERLNSMIATAERLADQPDWKGRASEAHLAVLPRQIEAMVQLREMAESAAQSVLLVGAIQNNIFDACALIFAEAIEQVRGQTSSAPTAFYSRCASCIMLLTRVDALLGQWISGEGTWRPSASQIADGLTETSGTGFEWPKAVSGSAAPPSGKHEGDAKEPEAGSWKSTVTEVGITVTTPSNQDPVVAVTPEPVTPEVEAPDGAGDGVARKSDPEATQEPAHAPSTPTEPAPDQQPAPSGPEQPVPVIVDPADDGPTAEELDAIQRGTRAWDRLAVREDMW